MPFDESLKEISDIIADAAAECGLQYVRCDREKKSGAVLSQIHQGISDAAVIVADITGGNQNVLYELGIAHQLKGNDRVVIITQKGADVPYDLTAFQYLGSLLSQRLLLGLTKHIERT